jgi:hypothetical protein
LIRVIPMTEEQTRDRGLCLPPALLGPGSPGRREQESGRRLRVELVGK